MKIKLDYPLKIILFYFVYSFYLVYLNKNNYDKCLYFTLNLSYSLINIFSIKNN